ncbi:MAG TPA: D-sedoheptulose 7-phosphate isomerase [Stenotrophobium sp.]|jgi:D-sedoheptulose 7-phosphate isomerase|nr:D-sedoheptulose 7-phosphate isomerase [Stenotrophobium sp.]
MSAVSLSAITTMIGDSIVAKQKLLADESLLQGILEVTKVCVAAFRRGNKVMLAGNGGSAADAQHIAAEFVARFEFDRPGLPSIALTTDTSALTAIGNDYGYEFLFSRQVEALGREGDVFIGITTSGNSRNILKAMESCAGRGIVRVALCGAGGQIKALSDHCLAVPSTHTPRIQESHILIGHIICALCEEELFAGYRRSKA